MSKKVTIKMVAERAGVSRGTVDRVLNQRPHVRTDVYERVIQAMRELNYVPPKEAQAEALGLTLPSVSSFKLGVVLPNWQGYFKREVMRGIRDAQAVLEAYSVEVIVEECETDLPDESIERMDHLADQQVLGMAVCAKDHISVIEKIDELKERNIPVVTFNSDVSGSKRLCFIGQDLVRGGRVAGELMAKYLDSDDQVLIAVGNSEFHAHRLRLRGFCERMQERGFSEGHYRIIETYNDYTLTYQKVREALKEFSGIKGIYMANHSTTGCVEAVRDSEIQRKLHIISHDLTDETKRLLQKNEIDFTIAQNIYRQGYRPLIILREYIQQHILPQSDIEHYAIEIMCAENLIG
ncbi:LacI family DNA-binding transcriptional regulator [Anaerostipes sp.]|uniref:LacI family DNA-binding transcriptional regulator n=1 Tax=Anaerostipes sp. TaxID=1872530 RepID=UPI002692B8D5